MREKRRRHLAGDVRLGKGRVGHLRGPDNVIGRLVEAGTRAAAVCRGGGSRKRGRQTQRAQEEEEEEQQRRQQEHGEKANRCPVERHA